MSVKITREPLERLREAEAQLEEIYNKPTLTARDRENQVNLVSRISSIRAGAQLEQIRNMELSKLLGPNFTITKAAATKLPAAVEKQWRDFTAGKPMPKALTPSEAELRATQNIAGQQSITYTQAAALGTFVPTEFADRLYAAQKQYDQIFDENFCNVCETEFGGTLPFPILDDVAAAAVIVNQTQQTNSGTPISLTNIGQKQLEAYSFRSGKMIFSSELLQDSAFPIGAVFEKAIAERFARGIGYYLIRGSGPTTQPTGLLTDAIASGAVITIASGSATNTGGSETGANSIGSADLYKVYKNLNPAYRANAVWAMTDNTLLAISQLIDKMGRPLFNLRDGVPYLLGKRIAICPSMPEMGAASNPIVFYNPDYFVQRRVVSSPYVRYVEAPALVENGLIAIEAWQRTDSGLLSANSSYVPASILQQHS